MRRWLPLLAFLAAVPTHAEPALTGRLVGQSYSPKEVVLVDRGDLQELRFSDDATGAPCDLGAARGT